MQYPDIELGSRGYNPAHIGKVVSAIRTQFPGYFDALFPTAGSTEECFASAISEWNKEKIDYQELLDTSFLDEYRDDPNAFKAALRHRCPIIRRCLNSPMEEMKDYKRDFGISSGHTLLNVTINIAEFAHSYINNFSDSEHEQCQCVDDLGLSALIQDGYTAYGVIGGGIKSHFLYKLDPRSFSHRSQNAIWSLYYLTDRNDFGFRDGSEFLMVRIEHDKNHIYQNYHYPYDLFSYYALQVYLMIQSACVGRGVAIDSHYRYVYVDAFFELIAGHHHVEIQELRGREQYNYYG